MSDQQTDDPALALLNRVAREDLQRISHLRDSVPVPIGTIAEALGLDIVSLTLPSDISGLIKQTESAPDKFQIQVNNTDAPVRQRFTVAHEVAHYLIHRDMIGFDGITDSILFRSKLSNRVEAEANRLAAALLLPWKKVQAWHQQTFSCPPNSSHIEETAAAFKVSSLAVGFRFGI